MKKSLPRKKAAVTVKADAATTRKKKSASGKKPTVGISAPKISAESSSEKKKTPKKVSLKTSSKASAKASAKGTPKSQKAASPKSQKHSKTSAKATEKSKCGVLPLNHSPQPQSSLPENNPPMISLENYADQDSMTYSESLYGIQPRKKPSRKKSRRAKIVRNRSFYGLEEEVDFELEGHEFLDEELISLDEFDSILHETQGETFNGREIEDDLEMIEMESHKIENCRKDLSHSTGPDKPARRKKVQRRRQIDPTTCERDYSTEEVEFMTALDEYKRNSGRMFPTCSEILEVLLGLGYAKAPDAEPQEIPAIEEQPREQTVISTTDFSELHDLTNFTNEIQPTIATIDFEYPKSGLASLMNDSFSIFGISVLPEEYSMRDLEQTFWY